MASNHNHDFMRDLELVQSVVSGFADLLLQYIDGDHRPPPAKDRGLSKDFISRFLETTTSCETSSDDDVCSICLDQLYQKHEHAGRRDVGVLECRHRFHADCIGEWLSRKNNCPICKAIGIKIDPKPETS